MIGTNESTSREAWADNHLGDVADLDLMGQQDELVDAMLRLGKPVVAVLINGRPLAIPELAERVPAILEGWYAGQEGGTAMGEVLFGDVNPGGKLPVTIPRHVGQLPVYYNRRPTSFRSHLDLSREPLWPFGHGLSYTTFTLRNLHVTPDDDRPGGNGLRLRRRDEHRRARRRRSGAALHPRRRQLGHAADEGAARLRARHARAGRDRRPSPSRWGPTRCR